MVKLGANNKGNITKTINYIVKIFKLSKRTLYFWIKDEKEQKINKNNNNNNKIKEKKKVGRKPIITKEQIDELLNTDEGKDMTLKEIADKFNVAISTVYYTFFRNNITLKKKK